MTKITSNDITADISTIELCAVHRGQEMILKLMARASEAAYRRGFQQGVYIAQNRPDDLPADLHGWRYGESLDVSPAPDSDRVEPSVRRLQIENPGLGRIGLV